MKTKFTFVLIFCSLSVFAQDNKSFQLGINISTITSPNSNINIFAAGFEATFMYYTNPQLALGVSSISSVGFDLNKTNGITVLQQEDFNLYYNVFHRLFNDRILVGAGLSLMNTWTKTVDEVDLAGNPISYYIDDNFLLGVNFTVDYIIWQNEKHELHLNACRRAFFSESNTAIGVKLGKRF